LYTKRSSPTYTFKHLGLVQFSAKSLLTILDDILDFSKIEAGKLETEAIQFESA